MDIYYCCSYSTSPVGFILGHIPYTPEKTKYYKLDEDNIPTIIRRCFRQGIVQRVLGVIPPDTTSSPKYCILAKELAVKGKGDEPTEYYLNIAIVTKNESEYCELLRKGGDSEQDIAEAIKATIQIDRENDFGYIVRPEQLDALMGKSFRALFDEKAVDHVLDALGKGEHNTYFGLLSSKTDLNELEEVLKLSDSNKELQRLPNSPKWVCYGKKKRSTRPLPWVALLGGIALIIAFLISRVVK